ncbi:hypothetical protein MJO28_006878 [Puccinia striiformis f. sp. tritici]|uniref:Uncharacterized protein n=1 Tax=Puccinia striiformis f. sp. tritici TaxID=168172 RepID=A0ACC0EEK3_9BASI|nr:hypothetical protein MJO28_006878 [Puccinia striiformis f. sp. tritici]
MVSNIITRLLVLIAGFATNYVSAYFCTMPTFNQAACMKINYSTGGLQGADCATWTTRPSSGGSKPGAPNRNDKFGCADGNVNTPLCCSLVSSKFNLITAGHSATVYCRLI